MNLIFNSRHIILLCLCFVVLSCKSQKNIVKSIDSEINYALEGRFTMLHKDQLGHIYLSNTNNEIIKLDKDLKPLFQFSISRLGKIASIDVSNPQKIMVYYPEYYSIVFLDNTLSEIKRLDLEALDYWDISATAMSRDNFIWIFNPVNFRMLKINEQGELFNSSNELYSEGIDVDSELSIMVHEEQVYLYNENYLWEFDNYGQYLKRMDLKNDGLQFINKELIFSKDQTILRQSLDIQFSNPTKELIKLNQPFKKFVLDPSVPNLILIDQNGLYLKNL